MKKTILKCLAVASLAFASLSAFAETSAKATITIEPNSVKTAKVNVSKAIGKDTMITVTNYSTTNSIIVTFPDAKPATISHEMHVTYKLEGYQGPSYVIVQGINNDGSQPVIFNRNVNYQDAIDVFLRKVGWIVQAAGT